MAFLRETLRRDYENRLTYWRGELERADPNDAVKLEHIRDLIRHYERQIEQLDQQHEIGAGPTLGGDGKPIIDC